MRYAVVLFAMMLMVILLQAPLSADVTVDDIIVRWEGPTPEHINIRARLFNTGNTTENGPIEVKLFIRADSSESWRELITWNNIPRLPAQNKVSRDYLPKRGDTLDPALATGTFQVRVTATSPDGLTLNFEKQYIKGQTDTTVPDGGQPRPTSTPDGQDIIDI